MKVGYMRISTGGNRKQEDAANGRHDKMQTFDLQRDALLAAGVEQESLYEDVGSGSKDDRLGLAACIKSLRKGDTLVIWRLDRLGRNLKHLIETVEELSKRGIGFQVITGAPIDTTTSQGKLMFAIFAGLAEFERDIILERTMAGLAAARARGRIGGRKHVFTKSKLHWAQAAMMNRDTNVVDLCAELGVSRATLYNYVAPDGKFTARAEALLNNA